MLTAPGTMSRRRNEGRGSIRSLKARASLMVQNTAGYPDACGLVTPQWHDDYGDDGQSRKVAGSSRTTVQHCTDRYQDCGGGIRSIVGGGIHTAPSGDRAPASSGAHPIERAGRVQGGRSTIWNPRNGKRLTKPEQGGQEE